jgi:hypothetical protein
MLGYIVGIKLGGEEDDEDVEEDEDADDEEHDDANKEL